MHIDLASLYVQRLIPALMVHRGFSRGCHECRRRRKRCDGTIPTCNNCTARGTICPGYRHAGDFMFLEPNVPGTSNTSQARRRDFLGDVEAGKPLAATQSSSSDQSANSNPNWKPAIDSHKPMETRYKMIGEGAYFCTQTGISATGRPTSREELFQTQVFDLCNGRALLATSSRIALYDAWAKVFLPKGHKCMSITRMVDFASRNKLLQHALDMVSLLHVGSAIGDVQYCNAAQVLHHQVTFILNRDLFEVSKATALFIAIIQLLTMSEVFKTITPSDSQWQVHTRALGHMYNIWGEQWRTAAPADAVKDFLNSLRVVFPLWLCLGSKKYIAGFDAVYCTAGDLMDASYLSSLHAHAFRSLRYIAQAVNLGRNLQRDHERDRLNTEILLVSQQLMEREDDLNCWLAKWREQSPDAFALAEDTILVNSQFAWAAQPLFPQAWHFNSVESAYLYTLYWMLLLEVRSSLFSLSKTIDDIAERDSDPKVYMLHDTYAIAKNLCMSLPYLMHSESGHLSLQLARMPIQLACRWFKENGYMIETQWCGNLVARTNWFGQHAPLLE